MGMLSFLHENKDTFGIEKQEQHRQQLIKSGRYAELQQQWADEKAVFDAKPLHKRISITVNRWMDALDNYFPF